MSIFQLTLQIIISFIIKILFLRKLYAKITRMSFTIFRNFEKISQPILGFSQKKMRWWKMFVRSSVYDKILFTDRMRIKAQKFVSLNSNIFIPRNFRLKKYFKPVYCNLKILYKLLQIWRSSSTAELHGKDLFWIWNWNDFHLGTHYEFHLVSDIRCSPRYATTTCPIKFYIK